jgi:protein-S-isoprenylcysteine O-methyltransferase Ste14
MSQAFLPFAATAVFAFAVYRWVSDELGRERRLSPGAGNALLALLLLLTSLVVISALGGVARLGVGGELMLGPGLLMAAVGAALAAGAVRALGSRERLLAARFDTVVSTGPYRYARHPFYLGCTAALLGVAVAGSSAVAIALALLLGVALLEVARAEERFLMQELGHDYASYRRRTPALLGRPQRSKPMAAHE